MAEQPGDLENTRARRSGAPPPPPPPVDVRALLAELSRRIREAQRLVDAGAPLPAKLRGAGTAWMGRLATGLLRKLGRGLTRDQRHATHAVSIALESAGDAVNALHERQEEMAVALEEANRARERYAEILSYLMSTAAQLRVIEERMDGLRAQLESESAARTALAHATDSLREELRSGLRASGHARERGDGEQLEDADSVADGVGGARS